MPNPNAHEQPAEGGPEQVERALQKQSEPPPQAKKDKTQSTPQDDKKDKNSAARPAAAQPSTDVFV